MATSPVGHASTTLRGRAVGIVGAALITLGLLSVVIGVGQARAQDDQAPVHVIRIDGEIDLGLAPFLQRTLEEAAADGAAAFVLEIDTPGGRLDAVLQMRDALLRSELRTVAYVDPTAFSAGALIALASEEIHMAPSAVMGAATPVDGAGVAADEKVIAAVRSTFRATAEQRDRDPEIAAAMVDTNVVVEGLVGRGELLSMTTSEAVEFGYADSVPADRAALLDTLGLADAPVVEVEQSAAERFVRFITNPILASLFLMAGWLLIMGDMGSGGIGAGTGLGAMFLGVFFWGHLAAGLAGWEDLALIVLGILLILVELLVLPGFGVPGLLGLAALLGGTFMAMVNRDFDFVGTDQIVRAGTTVGFAFVLTIVVLIVLLRFLSRRDGPPGVVLRTQLGSGTPAPQRSTGWLRWFGDGGVLSPDQLGTGGSAAGPDAVGDVAGSPSEQAAPSDVASEARGVVVTDPRPGRHGALEGATGVALSDLRPAGVADIAGRRIDVVTEGEYIKAGELIEVAVDEGYRRVVRRSRG